MARPPSVCATMSVSSSIADLSIADVDSADVDSAVAAERPPDPKEPLSALLRALRAHDASARLVDRNGTTARYCTNERCLCSSNVIFHGHTIVTGHVALDEKLDVAKSCARIASTPCSCCKALRAQAKRLATTATLKTCYSCGRAGHVRRDCTFGSTLERSQRFLQCSERCFVRRFVVPLHRASSEFRLDDLRDGRVDLAARVVASALVSSQRTRHNSEVYLPFLGDARPSTMCVAGGVVRGLHPSEASIAARLRLAFDHLRLPLPGQASKEEASKEDTSEDWVAAERLDVPEATQHELRGFRRLDGGFEACLSEALALAREGGTRAPLLLLEQGAPPMPTVLAEAAAADSLKDVVVVLGDDIGLSASEVEMVWRVGEAAGGGGPVFRASLGAGALLASHCIVIAHHYMDAIHECPARLWEAPSHEATKAGRQRRRRVQRQPQPWRQQHQDELCTPCPAEPQALTGEAAAPPPPGGSSVSAGSESVTAFEACD